VVATEALRRVLPAWALQRGPWRVLLVLLLLVVSWFAFARVQFDDGGLPLDKGRHLAAFAALAWVAAQAFAGARAATTRIALALLAYGVFIELVQSQIPGRFASGLDVAADACGVVIGLLAARLISLVR
jgi:VanZ family protein